MVAVSGSEWGSWSEDTKDGLNEVLKIWKSVAQNGDLSIVLCYVQKSTIKDFILNSLVTETAIWNVDMLIRLTIVIKFHNVAIY